MLLRRCLYGRMRILFFHYNYTLAFILAEGEKKDRAHRKARITCDISYDRLYHCCAYCVRRSHRYHDCDHTLSLGFFDTVMTVSPFYCEPFTQCRPDHTYEWGAEQDGASQRCFEISIVGVQFEPQLAQPVINFGPACTCIFTLIQPMVNIVHSWLQV